MSVSKQRFVVQPGQSVAGEIAVPGDKSISHRALMLAAVASGSSTIDGFLRGEDCLATLDALRALGVEIEEGADGLVRIDGVGSGALRAPDGPLDLGNSGTACRLMMGLLAGRNCQVVLTGDDSLRGRPMERVAGPLRQMGANIETQNGTAPVRIEAVNGLEGIDYTLPVASAQIKSALLLAGLTAAGETVVRSPATTRDHTERMLAAMGASVVTEEDGLTVRLAGPCELRGQAISVPGDLSSAAFFIVGACIEGDGPLRLKNVGVNPSRAGVLTILEAMGAHIEVENLHTLGEEPTADIVVHGGSLHGIDVPVELIPLAIDELPIVAIAAAAAEGRTVIRGADELRHKETDRIGAMVAALKAVGVAVSEHADGMTIDGSTIRGGTVDSLGDHRIAMSFAIASLAATAPIEILECGQVATSFPGFVDTAARAGLEIRVETGAPA